MEYENGNSRYQSLGGYGMSSPEGQCLEGYGQMSFGPMRGGQSRFYEEPTGYNNGFQNQDESRNSQSGSAAFGGPGYRSPLRYNKVLKEMSSRNGLYSPMDRQRSGGGHGDYYNSLPGIGGHEGQMSYQTGSSGNYY